MADKFVCTENPEHVFPYYSGMDDPENPAPDIGKSWFECDQHHDRIKLGYGDTPDCQNGGVCGHPPEDHPSTAERMTGQVLNSSEHYLDTSESPPRNMMRVDYKFPVWSHAYEGDGGPCQEPVGMHKLVGFLCFECGAPIEGMPTKAA